MALAKDTRIRVPDGVRDMLFAEAEAARVLEGRLAACFQAWGYREVRTPTFEFLETLSTGASGRDLEALYKFVDRRGRILALRPDMTTPIARLVATHGTAGQGSEAPLRIWYAGQVFRYEEERKGRPHEFRQAGIELIGASGPQADGEVLALAVTALQEAGLEAFTLALGHVDIVEGLWDGAGVPEEARTALREALARRDYVAYEQGLAELALGAAAVRALVDAVGLSAEDPGVRLQQIRGLCTGRRAAAALDDLLAAVEFLRGRGLLAPVGLDLSLVRDFAYYTGIVFEGYARGASTPVLGGGRYDRLLGRFGADRPATGFALSLDHVLAALEVGA